MTYFLWTLAGIAAAWWLLVKLVNVPLCNQCDDGSCASCQEDALAGPGEEAVR